eukprot:g17074.t1
MSDTAKSNRARDEVAEILKGLNLDKVFFSQKLSSDRGKPTAGQPIGGNAPAVGTGFRRRPSMVARRFPDFDVYLNESLMPVLAQALDALGRQVSRMHQQGDKLDARVRARFNPITWLAQQLLRRHPRVANTPRRISLYRTTLQRLSQTEKGATPLTRRLSAFDGERSLRLKVLGFASCAVPAPLLQRSLHFPGCAASAGALHPRRDLCP